MNEISAPFELGRLLLGDKGWFYLLEIVVRTAIIYVFALIVLRALGKRGMGQLSPFDFIIIFALGGAVGDPMFNLDVPLLHGMVAVAAIVALTRGFEKLTGASRKVRDFVNSAPTRLVIDGRLDIDGISSENIDREEIFESLRISGVSQLGQVERAYLEDNGHISSFLFPAQETRPGLPLLPDNEQRREAPLTTGAAALRSANYACLNCGETIWLPAHQVFPSCPRCDHKEWRQAIYAMGREPPQSSSDKMAR